MTDSNTIFEQIRTNSNYDLTALLNEDGDVDDSIQDSPFNNRILQCGYYEPHKFSTEAEMKYTRGTSCFHINCRGLSNNWEGFRHLLCELHSEKFAFDFIGVSEAYRCDGDTRLILPGYHDLISRCRIDGSRGGFGLFIKDNIQYKIRQDLSVFEQHVFESVFVEVDLQSGSNLIVGVIYRPNTAPKADIDKFMSILLEKMDQVNTEKKIGLIMGDMNVDLLKFHIHSKTSDYLDNIFSRGYLPVILKPTRVCASTATLIDHIYTHSLSSSCSSGIIITDLADHFGTYLSISNNIKTRQKVTRKSRIFSENNISKFKDILTGINLLDISEIRCVNEAYNSFIHRYKTALDTAFPLKDIKAKRSFIKREPWATNGFLVSSRNKTKLFKKKTLKPTVINIQMYQNYNRIFNKLKRVIKIKYYNDIIEENKLNMKKMWMILNKTIGKQNDKSSFPAYFNIDGACVSDKLEIAEGFNKYFSHIGLKTGQNVPATPHNFMHYLPQSIGDSIFIEPITTDTVISTADKLKPKLSSGHDDISSKLLKETISIISEPLTHIINVSLDSGIVPDELKIAKVVPIYKAVDNTILNNYRPISLLSAFSKVLEKIMFDKIMNFLNFKNILYKHQYGFRSKHSTIHPIIHFLNFCAEANNKSNPEFTLAVLCDLSKAFDVIDHDILLHKLNKRPMGLIGPLSFCFHCSFENCCHPFYHFSHSIHQSRYK